MLRRFLLAWRFARDLRFSEGAESRPWDDKYQKFFETFMTSPAGVLFGARMRNFAVSKAMFAVKSNTEHQWNAGIAYGAQLAIAYMESHLPSAKPFEPAPVSEEEAAIQKILDEVSNG